MLKNGPKTENNNKGMCVKNIIARTCFSSCWTYLLPVLLLHALTESRNGRGSGMGVVIVYCFLRFAREGVEASFDVLKELV